MAVDPELYRYREQSYIKHQFLTKYLQLAAFKILQGSSPIFNFVDAFAGPWNVSDGAEYTDTSFDQAINTLEAVRVDLVKRGNTGLKIRFCFCERKPESVARLKEYALSKKGFEIHVFHGLFEDNLENISRAIPDGFTFTFIDPLGWNIQSSKIFKFLKQRQRGEFILNFMADHINRHAEYNKVTESFGRLLADPEWENDYAALPKHLDNQDRVLYLLKTKMKQAGVATYLPDFSIMVPRKERVKMRLVLGTHSAEGLKVFREVHANVERQQNEMRNGIRKSDPKQEDLFSPAQVAETQQENDGVGSRRNRVLAEDRIKSLLNDRKSVPFDTLAFDVLENVAIRMTEIRDLVTAMKLRDVVSFVLPPNKRKPQESTRISLNEGPLPTTK